ncbi:toll-like receptor 6 [Amphiura filiformis]|uniref:toll-like receptor 6 n=1 Tax=Amphiura filiformis TaxID=82378 RepID=UPI003B20DE3B
MATMLFHWITASVLVFLLHPKYSYESKESYESYKSDDSYKSEESYVSDKLYGSHGSSMSSAYQYASELVTILPTEQPPCTYPTGSIVCKTWNQTNVDCAWRFLTCIPHLPHAASVELLDLQHNLINVLPDHTFSEFHNLRSLYLGLNSISFIGNYTFSGLRKLTVLDLRSNYLKTVSGSPFQDLVSLKTLNFRYDGGIKTVFGDASFAGLKHLEELQLNLGKLTLDSIKNASQELSSLVSLTIVGALPYHHFYREGFGCSYPDLVEFTKLTYLAIDKTDACIDLCSHPALQTLHLIGGRMSIDDICPITPPLKSLTLGPWYSYNITQAYEKLHNLRSISLMFAISVWDFIQPLQWLNSPLENVTLIYGKKVPMPPFFNALTFEPLAMMNASLHRLTLSAQTHIEIDGSPFKWFPKLQRLVIESNSLTTLSEFSFKGLDNLQELYLNIHNTDIFASKALHIFYGKNSLKTLNLANNDINFKYLEFEIWDGLCQIQSLEYLELSDNQVAFALARCTFPHLQTLVAQQVGGFSVSLRTLDLHSMAPNLQTIYISKTYVGYSLDVHVDMPFLEELHLNGIHTYDGLGNAIDVFRSFDAPKLTYLDLRSNQISIITKEDTILLSNLTFLNLASNTLTSFDYVQYLVNIETLILRGNKLSTIPNTLMTKSVHPFMSKLDLTGNALICDCNIEAFKTWIMKDRKVYLQNIHDSFEYEDEIGKCNYCCVSPDVREGLSITEIDLDCKSYRWLYILIGIISAVFLIIGGFIVALYHWNIKNRLFLLFNRRRDAVNYLANFNGDDDIDENGIPRYDAYVSYCNEDEDWICDELDAIIEGGEEPLRLCIRGRDIPANKPILESISLYMKRSRKILAIISPRYMEDQGRNKCKFELSLAHQRLLEENDHVLILILLEEIPDNEMTLMMRQLFLRVQCLKWAGDACGQGIFWQRLREELKRRVPVDDRYEV